MPGESQQVTLLLQRWQSGEGEALEKLMPFVYSELRRLAGAQMTRERPEHTLQPTALVHELFLRMAGSGVPPVETRRQFYAIAARAMRQILVDHARRHAGQKRGGGAVAQPFEELLHSPEGAAEAFTALDQALDRLAEIDPRKARAVELRYFVGLEMAEAADLLSVSVMTLHRDLRFAGAWIKEQLRA